MATAVDLISHGAGEGLYYCLNAMAALFHGGKYSFVASIMAITSMFAASIAVYKMVLEQNLKIPAQWLLANSMLTIALTIPTTNVMIIDRVTGFRSPVANVPWLFAVPAGFMSQIGDVVAKQIDAALSIPAPVNTPTTFKNAITANRNGVAMSAKLIANASHFDFVSNDMANNMREFVKECVYYDIALGKYRVDELKSTDDLWAFISANASPLGGVIYQSTSKSGPVRREFLSCNEAAVRINQDWPEELRKAYQFYGKKLFPFGGGPRGEPSNLLKRNLVQAYDYLTNISKSADNIMQQNIMRNAIQDGFMARAQEDGAIASIQSYAVARAEAYQESVYATQGGIAEKAISYMKIVIEIIFYGMFPFVAIMLMLPSGINMLKTYFTGLIWLQSWAPLYSLINMIIHVYCRNSTFAASTTLTTPALTFDTIPALGEAGVFVARYAGYAMMSVPFLSWGLFKYGGGALAQMSSYMGQPTQSASGMAAGEISSGNMSFGVRNFDSTARNNINSFKQDESANISSGATSFQASDGSIMRTTSGGEGIIDRVASMSKLGIGITDKNEIASSMNEMSLKSLSNAQTSLTGYTNSRNAAHDLIMDFRKSRGDSLSNDSSIGLDHATSASRAFQKVDDIVDSYSRLMGVDKRESVESLNSISAGIDIGGSIGSQNLGSLGKLLNKGISVNAGAGHKHQWTDADVQNINTTSQEQMQLSQKYTEAMDEVSRVFQNESLRNSSTEATNFSDGLSSRLSEADSCRKDVQNSLTESEAWQKSANLVSTSSVGVSEDISQEFVNWASYQLGPDGYELGVGGVKDAMDNPVLRKQLLEGFIRSHRNQVLSTFAGQSLTSSSIKNNFVNNSAIPEQDLQNKYNSMSQSVIVAASNKNLDAPVDSSVKSLALNQIVGNSGGLSENRQNHGYRKDKLLDNKNNFEANHKVVDD